MKKRSDHIRAAIGGLIYEQQLFQQDGNDGAVERTEIAIERLRSKLKTVEDEEKSVIIDDEGQG